MRFGFENFSPNQEPQDSILFLKFSDFSYTEKAIWDSKGWAPPWTFFLIWRGKRGFVAANHNLYLLQTNEILKKILSFNVTIFFLFCQ